MSELLRQYIKVTLDELRIDAKMMSMLRGTGLRDDVEGSVSNKEAMSIAQSWLDELENPTPHTKMRVRRYVTRKWPMLVKRFRGDKKAAQQTLYNLLDTKSNETG
jgi:hypothetical protein